MARPILAVDVDGVVTLFDLEEPPDPSRVSYELIDGVVQCVSMEAGPRLRCLSERYDLIWASGWEERANEYLLDLLGLPELPFIGFHGSARFGSADWKLEPLGRFAVGRALAWLDDSFDERCCEWARARQEPTLLMPAESREGLTELHVEALLAWAENA